MSRDRHAAMRRFARREVTSYKHESSPCVRARRFPGGRSGMLDSPEIAATEPKGVGDLRDEEGAIRTAYVEAVEQAIVAGDAEILRELVGDLHDADTGDLIEA